MALGLQDQHSFEVSHLSAVVPNVEDFVADLTAAAYRVGLRHTVGDEWLDLELGLWKVLAQTVKKWEQRGNLPFPK